MNTFAIKRVGGHVGLADVDNAVDVEGNLLCVGAPVLVTEAVEIFPIMLSSEGVVAVGNTLLIGLVLTSRVRDLSSFD